MASSSTQKPSSSSSSVPTRKFHFDVFLSFRGEDTRYNFTDHLFVNLDRMGINTFRDDQLERGEEIKQELLGTIEGSRCSVIVFSERYADSKWCLDELTKIMECKREMGQIVLPVFYHVDPSHVRKQTGSFGTEFAKHEINIDEKKVQRWRAAMTEASSLSGWHVIKDYEYESNYIKEITNEVLKRLNPKLLHIDGEMVGMDLRLKELKLLLSCHLNDVRVVGIYGIGGIGKTTIARVLYNEIQCQFDGTSFLQDVRERSKKGCQLQLQQQLLNGTVGKDIKFSDIDEGINIIKGRLSSKKVLIVIDDVDDLNQLQPLVRREWFGSGSRIIITTRNQHLLDESGVLDTSYKVKELYYEEAIKLFNMHAFKQNVPKKDYVYLSKCMVDYAQGLPLALKVIGSSLHCMKLPEWESKLAKLKKCSDKKINGVLRISYDELDESEKKVFLDIACFFKGEDKDFVLTILDSCNLFATYNIRVLCDRCLITISNNMVQMHDLIQQMGWAIVREECLKDPSKWSRLWDVDDINKAFSRGEGMNNIETIYLDLSRSKEIQLSSKALAKMKIMFATMKKLRLLKVYYNDHHSPMRKDYKVFLPKYFEFPPNLIYLHWKGYPSNSLPSNFHGENLVALNLMFSNIKELWKSEKHLAELKFIDLSYSQQLIKIPKFSRMPKLERLNLEGCTSFHNLDSSIGLFHDTKFSWKLYLTKFFTKLNFSDIGIKELPSSIGSLTSLEMLSLSGCSKFEKFPNIFENMLRLRELRLDESGIKELPSSIGSLTSLEILDMNKCSQFEEFPDIFANMGNLRELRLGRSGIKELPSSIGSLTSLETLNLSRCSKFEKFPDIFVNMGNLRWLHLRRSGIKELPSSIGYLESLETLELSNCSNFENFPEILGNMRCLKDLFLNGTAIKKLPNNIGCLEALETLSLSHCSNLEKLPEFQRNMGSLHYLSARGTAIKELPCSMGHLTQLQWLDLENCKNLMSLPSSIYELKSLQNCSLNGCSNIEVFSEITVDMEHLHFLYLHGMVITELPSSIKRLKNLQFLELSNCENLVTLPNSIGNLAHLSSLHVRNCSKLHKLPDNLRSLQCCLTKLDLAGCNLMEGAIPSDLWCLSSLTSLDVSENPIRCMPVGIIQLSKLRSLGMNHCPMLEEIPELPSSLRRIEAHGCPCLETLSCDPTHLLWSSLLNCLKSETENLGCNRDVWFDEDGWFDEDLWFYSEIHISIPGSSGIPEWTSHKSMGCEVRMELPEHWYKDDSFLGFALFFHHLPLDDDDDNDDNDDNDDRYELSISHGDQFKMISRLSWHSSCRTYLIGCIAEHPRIYWSRGYDKGGTSDPALCVLYFPQIAIPSEYRSREWNNFKARFNGSYQCGNNRAFKVKSCGIHLIYAQAQDHHQKRSRHHPTEDHPHHKRSRHV